MAEQNAELKKELKGCFEAVRDALQETKYNFHIWLEIFPIEAKLQVLNSYRGLFVPTMIAHKNLLYVNLYKVLDKRSDSYHFNCLFDLLEKENSIESYIIRDFREQIYKKHAATIKCIRKHRNKLIAHIDKGFVDLMERGSTAKTDPKPETKIDSKRSITIGEARALLKTLESIINDISIRIYKIQLSPRLDRAKDSERIITDLGAAIKARQAIIDSNK